MYASKLVMSKVSGSSPLVGSWFCGDLQGKRMSGRTSSVLNYSDRTATRAWQDLYSGHNNTSLTL